MSTPRPRITNSPFYSPKVNWQFPQCRARSGIAKQLKRSPSLGLSPQKPQKPDHSAPDRPHSPRAPSILVSSVHARLPYEGLVCKAME